MNKKEIILTVEFEGKKISYPVKFEEAKDVQIAEVISKRLLGIVDKYRTIRLNQVEISRELERK